MKNILILIVSLLINSYSYAQTAADEFYKQGCKKMKDQDFRGAISDFSKAIELDTNHLSAYNNRAVSKDESGEKMGAILDLDKTIELFSKNETSPSRLAMLYGYRAFLKNDTKNYQGALADYSKALEMDPKGEYYNYRGLIKTQTDDNKGAINDFTKAIELEPKNGSFYHSRGDAKYVLGDIAAACIDYKEAFKLGNNYSKEVIGKYCK